MEEGSMIMLRGFLCTPGGDYYLSNNTQQQDQSDRLIRATGASRFNRYELFNFFIMKYFPPPALFCWVCSYCVRQWARITENTSFLATQGAAVKHSYIDVAVDSFITFHD